MKQCNTCKETLPLDRFSKKSAAKDGLQPRCKGCIREYQKAYMQDPKKRKQRLDYHRVYNADNKLQRAIQMGKRRVEKVGLGAQADDIRVEELVAYWRRQSIDPSVCYLCNVDLSTLDPNDRTVDHMVPVSRGGTHTLENLFPCCRDCNHTKFAS
jgi:5-methylcytosine-specific restriction endonuclease McrA